MHLGETDQSETAIPGFQINKDTQFIQRDQNLQLRAGGSKLQLVSQILTTDCFCK